MNANRENNQEWEGKWEGKGFCQPNHPAAVILLVASITLKPYTHSATATDKCPQRSHFHMKAETEQKAIPAVCARSSPAVDSGSGCIHRQSRGKASAARTSNTTELPAFWSREMRICLCRSLHHPCSSPTPAMEWGEKFRRTGPLGLRQNRPEPTLCAPFVCGCMSDVVAPRWMCILFLCMLLCWQTILQHVCLF